MSEPCFEHGVTLHMILVSESGLAQRKIFAEERHLGNDSTAQLSSTLSLSTRHVTLRASNTSRKLSCTILCITVMSSLRELRFSSLIRSLQGRDELQIQTYILYRT